MQARASTQPVINSALPYALPPSGASAASPVTPNGLSVEAALLLHDARNAAFSEVAHGRMGQGLQLLGQALELKPMNHELLCDMAALLLSAGDLVGASDFAQQALTVRPKHGVSLYTLGFALSGQGEIKHAHAVLSDLMQDEVALDSLLQDAPGLLPVIRAELARMQRLARQAR